MSTNAASYADKRRLGILPTEWVNPFSEQAGIEELSSTDACQLKGRDAMRRLRILLVLAGLIGLLSSATFGPASALAAPGAAPVGAGFTYQGQLRSNGACDFQFSLWAAAGVGRAGAGTDRRGLRTYLEHN